MVSSFILLSTLNILAKVLSSEFWNETSSSDSAIIELLRKIENQTKITSDCANRIPDCAQKGGVYFTVTGRCYVQSSTTIANWDDARAECKKNGGDLATIGNQATQDFVVDNILTRSYTWIGAEKISSVWSWVDGTPWTGFANWASNEPQGTNVVVLDSAYQWYDTSKQTSSRYYLCEF